MIVVVLIISTSAMFQTSAVHASTSYVVHSPIVIVGNSGFTQQNGVTGGTGTRSDPFMISGWSIAAPYGQAAIRIESTRAFFLIVHVQLLNAQPGVYLTSVTNGAIENSTLVNSNFGIRIESSTNINITGNNISGTYGGVYSSEPLSSAPTTGLTIANNTFTRAGVVVWSSQSLSSNLNITGNSFISAGVSTTSYGAVVVRNNVTGTPFYPGGLSVDGNSSLVSENSIIGGDIGVGGAGTIVRNNKADRILLYIATMITLSNNVLTRGVLIQTNPPFDTPPYYDSHIMNGNTVNGKPLLYLARCSGANVDGTAAGEVIVANCSNVRLANLQLSGAQQEMILVYVHQASIIGNNFSGINSTGLDITHSSDLLISSNKFNGVQASIAGTDNVTLTGNLGVGDAYYATVNISGGKNFSVSSNTLRGNLRGTALNLDDVLNATLAGNWISDNLIGVMVSGANGLNITANNIVRNQWGLSLDVGTFNGIFNSAIYHNNFVDNSQHQAVHSYRVTAAFDNGYPSGGNYWSDYRGVDNCSGSQQNICPRPDGIGDSPYTGIWYGFGIPGTLLDHYPLVNPYGNFSWDTAAPTWPAGGLFVVSIANSTSITLQWTRAIDDSWIIGYRLYQDGAQLASLPRDAQSYQIAGLTPGSMHVFKVEAGDVGQNWSTNGPSNTATIPQITKPLSGGQSAASPAVFSVSWWMDHWYLGAAIGGAVAVTVASIVIVRGRRIMNLAQKKT